MINSYCLFSLFYGYCDVFLQNYISNLHLMVTLFFVYRCWYSRNWRKIFNYIHIIFVWCFSRTTACSSALRFRKYIFLCLNFNFPFPFIFNRWCMTFFLQEAQLKIADYRDVASSLHLWLRERTSYMSDRNFPPTLIEMKKIAQESNRFRTEEMPTRHRDKQRLQHIYRDLQVTLSPVRLFAKKHASLRDDLHKFKYCFIRFSWK